MVHARAAPPTCRMRIGRCAMERVAAPRPPKTAHDVALLSARWHEGGTKLFETDEMSTTAVGDGWETMQQEVVDAQQVAVARVARGSARRQTHPLRRKPAAQHA